MPAFTCTMCQNATGETCVFSSFCSRCQLLVDLVAAESHRDNCKDNLEKAEEIVSEKKLKAHGNKEVADESDKTEENDDNIGTVPLSPPTPPPPLVSALATKSSPKKKNVRW